MVVELIRGSHHAGCQILQTSVFSHIRSQLDCSATEERSAWCESDIVETVFAAATAESCTLVGNVVTMGNEEFKALVSHMPVSYIDRKNFGLLTITFTYVVSTRLLSDVNLYFHRISISESLYLDRTGIRLNVEWPEILWFHRSIICNVSATKSVYITARKRTILPLSLLSVKFGRQGYNRGALQLCQIFLAPVPKGSSFKTSFLNVHLGCKCIMFSRQLNSI